MSNEAIVCDAAPRKPIHDVPFEAETWGTPIEHEPEHEPIVPPDFDSPLWGRNET